MFRKKLVKSKKLPIGESHTPVISSGDLLTENMRLRDENSRLKLELQKCMQRFNEFSEDLSRSIQKHLE